jgi:MOSC domain-containing protein YiiM
MNELKSIAIKITSRAEMQTREAADVSVKNGISGDLRGNQGDRQITVLSESSWQKACDSLNTDLPWTTRRANLFIDGIEFGAADVGKILRIGDIELKITEETKPCALMDQQQQGLRSALTPDWRGGVCCRVITGGAIQLGDRVSLD